MTTINVCRLGLVTGLLALVSGCAIIPGGSLENEAQELGKIGLADPSSNFSPVVDEMGNVVAGTPAPHVPPAELSKVTLPAHRLAPSDILFVNGIRLAPKGPYRIQTQDFLQIVSLGSLAVNPQNPISTTYPVDASGKVNFGPPYGSVSVKGLTVEEATEVVDAFLRPLLSSPQVTVSLFQPSQIQFIQDQHLVQPDGTINLGMYGDVYVTGMTVAEARAAIEEHLSDYFDDPKVSVDIFAFNSSNYYLIFSGGGTGDSVNQFPITGNDDVLSAMSLVRGFDPRSTTKMWISRPAPSGAGCAQVLPIDWHGITREADPSTNYQLLPGDRLFVAHDRLIALDAFLGKIIQPVERMFGFTLLGSQTIQNLQRFPEGQQLR